MKDVGLWDPHANSTLPLPDEKLSSATPEISQIFVPPEASAAENGNDPRIALERTVQLACRLLGVLCGLAVMFTLYFGQAVFIPVSLSILLTLLLRPPVRWLYRRRIPEPVGATFCLGCVVIAIAAGVLPLITPARDWLDHFPQHMEQAAEKLHGLRDQFGQLMKVRSRIADLAAGESETQPVPVTVKEPELTSSAVVLSATGNMLGTWLVVVVLTFFLLTAGDSLINNLLTILPSFREKRRTVELIKEVERGLSKYLVTITMINLGLGFVVGMALWLLRVPNPAVWGLMTAVFNFVPFVGQGIAGLIIGIVALLSFDSVGYALLAPLVFYAIAAVEGNLITPSLLGRNMSLNPILVLLSLLCWGWMWGIAGAALAVPILAMLKIGFDHFECTRSAGTLLGG